jgi:hypothetical protein
MLPEGSIPFKDFGWHGVICDPALMDQCMKIMCPLASKWITYDKDYTMFLAPDEKQEVFVKELEKNCIWDSELFFQRNLVWEGK